jgi:hypothetical protein
MSEVVRLLQSGERVGHRSDGFDYMDLPSISRLTLGA